MKLPSHLLPPYRLLLLVFSILTFFSLSFCIFITPFPSYRPIQPRVVECKQYYARYNEHTHTHTHHPYTWYTGYVTRFLQMFSHPFECIKSENDFNGFYLRQIHSFVDLPLHVEYSLFVFVCINIQFPFRSFFFFLEINY